VGAYILAGALRGFLFGVDAHDPVIFGMVTLAVALVALLATWLPARRAGRLDPVQTIRVE
jgi:putative ABC transport system permease protein